MRDDLLDAQAAIDSGEAQFRIFSRRIRTWENESVETVIVGLNPQSGKKAVVARTKRPFPALISAEVGAIIGSFRSALDLLAASLARRR
ncbi:MAG: hypothetical protein ABI224_10735 [Acetobacteraceae bacterium]